MKLTARELRKELAKWSDDTEIVFGGTPTGSFNPGGLSSLGAATELR